MSTAVKWVTSDWLQCQVYHVFSQIFQTNTCHYVKLCRDHYLLHPYDSYRTSHPITLYCIISADGSVVK